MPTLSFTAKHEQRQAEGRKPETTAGKRKVSTPRSGQEHPGRAACVVRMHVAERSARFCQEQSLEGNLNRRVEQQRHQNFKVSAEVTRQMKPRPHHRSRQRQRTSSPIDQSPCSFCGMVAFRF